MISVIRRNRWELDKPDVLEKYGPYYDEFKKTGASPYFNIILMVRRLIMVTILLALSNFPGIQA